MGRVILAVTAAVLFAVGIIAAAAVDSAWKDYNSYTVAADGVVSQRTGTYAAIRLKGGPELPYAVISGTGARVPPLGLRFRLGDQVKLLHPLGQPTRARLVNAVVPPAAPRWSRCIRRRR